MTTQTTIDESRVEEFLMRSVGDLAGAMTTAFCALGDRLGLFDALTEGPASAASLAAKTGLVERYVREWADGLVTAGVLEHEAGRYTLPAEHAAVLADEGGPAFLAGGHQIVMEMLRSIDKIETAFRNGGGVSLDEHDEAFWVATERLTRPTFEHQLIQEFVPAIEGLDAMLRAGARVADVGCGAGIAAVKLAQAYPASTFTGIDIHPINIDRATQRAKSHGVDDRVTFTLGDAVRGIEGTYDVITILLLVHDTVDPLAVLRNVRGALTDDGVVLLQEINCADTLEGNAGPGGTLMYGFSLFHCMTQSLADGGAALGTCGLPESRLRSLCSDAGFGSVERVWEGPLDAVYALRP